MNQEDFEHFTCLVIGDNPEQQMVEYDSNKVVEPYVVFKSRDAHKMKQTYLNYQKGLLNDADTDDATRNFLQLDIETVEDESDDEFFEEYTSRYEHNKDGDAVSRENPNGRWRYYNEGGKTFSQVFKLKDGTDAYQARKGDIDWEYMHQRDIEKYERTWEMVMDGDTPKNEEEKNYYENMKNRVGYLSKFNSKEEYAAAATFFWTYAFLSKTTGWMEMNYLEGGTSWVYGFYKTYIEPLSDDTLLTIFECGRPYES